MIEIESRARWCPAAFVAPADGSRLTLPEKAGFIPEKAG